MGDLFETRRESNVDGTQTSLRSQARLPTPRRRLSPTDGVLDVVNAGHTAPVLQRGAGTRELHFDADVPLGLARGRTYRVSQHQIHPGDRLVVLTDGVTERRAESLDISARLEGCRQYHPREAVRYLTDAVLDITGHALPDDAAAFIIDWTGDHARERTTAHGANV